MFVSLSVVLHGCFGGSLIDVDLDTGSDLEGKKNTVFTFTDTDSLNDTALDYSDTSSEGSADTTTNLTSTDARIDSDIDTGFDFLNDPEHWQFYTVADIQDGPEVGRKTIESMYRINPLAAALFEIGDLTQYATAPEWTAHHMALQQGAMYAGGSIYHYRVDSAEFGPFTRFFGVIGNHDILSDDWLTLWNKFLPGQQELGHNDTTGVYYSVVYRNVIFIALDSNHPSIDQTRWLEQTLNGVDENKTPWKIVMMHAPVYPCNIKPTVDAYLDWVVLFEKFHVQLVLHGHAHTFERTCPMRNGVCAQDGVKYITASGGGVSYLRSVDNTKTGTLTNGVRTDQYACSEILDDYESLWHHFCHFDVTDCNLDMICFDSDISQIPAIKHAHRISRCNSM